MKQIYLLIFLSTISCLFGVERPISMQDIEVLYEAPTAEEFVHLRTIAGMRKRKVSSIEKAIEHTLFWVTLRNHGDLIGMGRVVGDGGALIVIADIAVHPEHQKKGYGRFILDTIQEYILQEVPEDAFVCLFANKGVTSFYQRKGFEFTEEKWPGMYWPNIDRAQRKASENNFSR